MILFSINQGISINGVPIVMYAPENVDFTNEIIETLNKPGRATASTGSNKKTGANASVSPAAQSSQTLRFASEFQKYTRAKLACIFVYT